MVTCIEETRGFDNPSTSIYYAPIRQDLQVPIPNDMFKHTRKWYENEVQSWGVPLSEVPSLVMTSSVMFDLVPFPTAKDTKNNSGHSEKGKLIGEPAPM